MVLLLTAKLDLIDFYDCRGEVGERLPVMLAEGRELLSLNNNFLSQ